MKYTNFIPKTNLHWRPEVLQRSSVINKQKKYHQQQQQQQRSRNPRRRYVESTVGRSLQSPPSQKQRRWINISKQRRNQERSRSEGEERRKKNDVKNQQQGLLAFTEGDSLNLVLGLHQWFDRLVEDLSKTHAKKTTGSRAGVPPKYQLEKFAFPIKLHPGTICIWSNKLPMIIHEQTLFEKAFVGQLVTMFEASLLTKEEKNLRRQLFQKGK